MSSNKISQKQIEVLQSLYDNDGYITSHVSSTSAPEIFIDTCGNVDTLHLSTFKALKNKALIRGIMMAVERWEIWKYRITQKGKNAIEKA